MPEKHERQPRPHDDRSYEPPAVTDLGAVAEFSQGDNPIGSIDDR